MKTDRKTVGFGGGFTDARTVRPRCRTAAVLRSYCGPHYRLAVAGKDARPVLQHRTGASNGAYQLTDDIIARMPRFERWALCAVAALTISGVIPMVAVWLISRVFDLLGWWLLIPLCIVIGRVSWRVIWS